LSGSDQEAGEAPAVLSRDHRGEGVPLTGEHMAIVKVCKDRVSELREDRPGLNKPIPTGKNKGKHPSVPGVYRVLADGQAPETVADRCRPVASRSAPVGWTGPSSTRRG
jgi:hypothetical protein